MPAAIKAVVFKTAKLKDTRLFFEAILKIPIKESSVRHFVIYSKNIRLVFVESPTDFETEIYINDKTKHFSTKGQWDISNTDFESCKDPNGIKIITT